MTKKAHLIGICGAGMSAVAHLLQEQGWLVSGSDEGFYPPVSDYLKKLGLDCESGYSVDNIPTDVSLIVIGKNAKLVPESNPEVEQALAHYKDKVKSFPQVLADLSAERNRVVIAGSYGKSTVTSIVTWCLVYARKDPGYFIGAIPNNLETSSALGKGKHFIFEGDEYPSANWDERSKFLHYDPDTVILTSACHDHVNIYPTLEDYHMPFNALLTKLVTKQGRLVACVGEVNSARMFEAFGGPKTSYGLVDGADWCAKDIKPGDMTSFSLVHQGDDLGVIKTSLLGRHNIENIVGAATWLIGESILKFEEFSTAIKEFEGIARRLDRKKINSHMIIYEGFGSSYEKARAAITAIADHFNERRLIILFEPHTFTWRNRAALDQYETAFDDVARVYLYAPPTQGSDTHAQLSLDEIKDKVAAHHSDVRTFGSKTYQAIISDSDPDKEVILILSSGNFDGLLGKILEDAERQYPTG